jgi:xylitol oxidase
MMMKKRRLLKLSAALLGAAAGPRLFGQAAEGPTLGGRLTNWAGNIQFGTNNLLRPTSLEEVRRLVKEHGSLRALGTRHCFNSIADSTHALISLKQMDQLVALDAKAGKVTVEAGMTYGQLGPYLHERGFALHNLASLPHISIAGACATATHGSGVKNGNPAMAVSALELVTAGGDILTHSRQNDGAMIRAESSGTSS